MICNRSPAGLKVCSLAARLVYSVQPPMGYPVLDVALFIYIGTPISGANFIKLEN